MLPRLTERVRRFQAASTPNSQGTTEPKRVCIKSDTQEEGPISIELPDCPSLENINEENLCIADDGTDGVKILDQCYSIENTTEINGPFSDTPSGNIPKEIGLLTNLSI